MTLSHAQVPPHHLALSFHSFSPVPPGAPGPRLSLLSDWLKSLEEHQDSTGAKWMERGHGIREREGETGQ